MRDLRTIHFKIKENTALSELDDQAILLNLDSGIYFKLNELGLFIVANLNHNTDFFSLVKLICNKYEISEKSCSLDLDNFLNQLRDRELLEIIE
tara:strand:- start:46 stop:327 length:282 start_codon:yes stop_codon:yes gene_type:complete